MLRPDAALALQRTAGNAAVSRLVAQRLLGRARGGSLQRKVGFELELDVLLTKGTPQAGKQALGVSERVGSKDDFVKSRLWSVEFLNAQRGRGQRVMHWLRTEKGTMALEWNPDSNVNDELKAIRPEAVPAEEPGRWVALKGGDNAAANELFDPHLSKTEKLFNATADRPFDVVEDHHAGELVPMSNVVSVPEIVTQPQDEFAGKENFEKPLVAAAALMHEIATQTQKFTKRTPASAIFPGARADLYLGGTAGGGSAFDLGISDVGSQAERAWVQVTYGVALAAVPRLFEARQADVEKPSTLSEKDIMGAAQMAAQKAMQTMSWDAAELPNLFGFLHLVAMYLRAGHENYRNKTDLDKNLTPFLVRHGMFEARYEGLTRRELTLVERQSEKLIVAIATASDRGPSERLFKQSESGPSVQEWLLGAFVGKHDPQLPEWGQMKHISPESVQPAMPRPPGTGEEELKGAVLEERTVAASHLHVNEWLPLARKFHKLVLDLNRPPDPTSEATLRKPQHAGYPG